MEKPKLPPPTRTLDDGRNLHLALSPRETYMNRFLTWLFSSFAPQPGEITRSPGQEHVHFFPAGALEDGQAEGWYFADEVEQLHGPYESHEEAETRLTEYAKTLDAAPQG